MRITPKKFVLTEDKMYDLLVRPLVTEKTSLNMALNQYTFEVARHANKDSVKAAVEKVFGVAVTKVNTLVQKGKTKRFKGRTAIRSDWKKAIVTLKEGQSIDMSVGK